MARKASRLSSMQRRHGFCVTKGRKGPCHGKHGDATQLLAAGACLGPKGLSGAGGPWRSCTRGGWCGGEQRQRNGKATG